MQSPVARARGAVGFLFVVWLALSTFGAGGTVAANKDSHSPTTLVLTSQEPDQSLGQGNAKLLVREIVRQAAYSRDPDAPPDFDELEAILVGANTGMESDLRYFASRHLKQQDQDDLARMYLERVFELGRREIWSYTLSSIMFREMKADSAQHTPEKE